MPNDDSTFNPSTPLIEALYLEDEQESIQWITELLASGEDPNKIDSFTNTNPLYEAWRSDRAQTMRILIEAGADGKGVAELPFEITYCFVHTSIEATHLLVESGFKT